MSIFIGGAWPYANGSLHLGHVASLLPGDIIARYYRLKGKNVLYVSGSDCNGTPIAVRAKSEGVSTNEIATRYHEEFVECFNKLGFTYDFYTRTDDPFHHEEVQEIFKRLIQSGLIYKKNIDQSYCEFDSLFLPDRYVEGTCPNCLNPARGDQCDYCSSLLDPLDLLNKKCKLCGGEPIVKKTEHLYFALSKLQNPLEKFFQESKYNWKENAVHLTDRYLKEGLKDRAASRDLENGVSVPIEGFQQKKIYVWIEAVSGYLTASKKWSIDYNQPWDDFWSEDAKSYYVHGKDNIPFHTLIWPSILIGLKDLKLPECIISSEYLTVEKKKLSTSRNWAVWVPEILESYHPDSIRYFLTINAPDKRDADFSWREFIYSHNSELLGAFGNFVNRTLKFIEKYYDHIIPSALADQTIVTEIYHLYEKTGNLIEKGDGKAALESIFDFIRKANKYFDERKPWIQIKENQAECSATLYTCAVIVANLSNLLEPFLPFTCQDIRKFLGVTEPSWSYISPTGALEGITPLFERIDIENIELERNKLGK
ncbi:methionine--tRNA ligase [Cytobacillus sp. FJAT-54145]|uniref:Methionine--tRNA ligase n=1 Tax=Cytobacillus spartinae TaxID=3299023 RepID=A0ABW6K773_9BACI